MFRTKIFLALFISLIFSSLSFSQGKLQFDTTNFNFGKVKEDGGAIEHAFKFKNVGTAPITVTHVQASCGCTTPKWTSEPVAPGESGVIVARYNPYNRPGGFNKSLRISTNEPTERPTLYISGNVKPKPSNPEKTFSVMVRKLGLKSRFLNMEKITTEKPVEKEFDVYHHGGEKFYFDSLKIVTPSHISIKLKEDSLNARQSGTLLVTYDSKNKNDYGYVSDEILLGDQKISVIATIEEFFPNMTPEKFDVAPKLQIENRIFEFGKVKKGEKIEAVFTLTNGGEEKLNFRKLKANCGCIDFKLRKSNLKRGKSQQLKVTFDTSDQQGNQYKSVSLFTNDPMSPTQVVTIKGKVEE